MGSKTRTVRHRALSGDWFRMVQDSQEETAIENRAHLLKGLPHTTKLKFVTESSYNGEFNAFGMAVSGAYRFVHGCEYEGGFEDGMFHGEGTLVYPMGQKLEGYWEKGKMVAYKFTNVDGLDYEGNWTYCTMPDRRFNISVREGLMPAGRELMTNQQPERYLEPGCYDTGDGIYNPTTRSVIISRDPDDYINLHNEDLVLIESEGEEFWMNAVRMVPENRHQWIINHCRKGWDEPAGYRPEFYEDWITGRRTELEELDRKYAPEGDSREGSVDSHTRELSFGTIGESMGDKSDEYAGTGRKLTLSDPKISGTTVAN